MTDVGKALGMIGRGRKIAMCSCGAPLISTMSVRFYEFYCLDCGRRYGWLDPTPADETPELIARCEMYETEWKALSDGLLSEGGHHTDCATCRVEEHTLHASADELAAHERAIIRIRERVKA